jgi:hypothetical protein
MENKTNIKEIISKISKGKHIVVEDILGYGFSFKREDNILIINPLSCAYGKVYKYDSKIKLEKYTLLSINELESIL